MPPPYAIIHFMADLEDEMLEISEKKPVIWWWYLDNIFFI